MGSPLLNILKVNLEELTNKYQLLGGLKQINIIPDITKYLSCKIYLEGETRGK